jgi:cadmium resistance protein CadD (predicted permease)
MCAIGGIGIVLACSWIYTKAKTINITICFIICALSLTFGIISLSFQSEVAKIIYIVVGSILVLLGIIEIYIAIKEIKKKNKRDKSKKKPAIVEAEIVEQIENNDDIKQIENNENDIKVIENKE